MKDIFSHKTECKVYKPRQCQTDETRGKGAYTFLNLLAGTP